MGGQGLSTDKMVNLDDLKIRHELVWGVNVPDHTVGGSLEKASKVPGNMGSEGGSRRWERSALHVK